jgi:hypothetical protein
VVEEFKDITIDYGLDDNNVLSATTFNHALVAHAIRVV